MRIESTVASLSNKYRCNYTTDETDNYFRFDCAAKYDDEGAVK